ncbi:MAG: FmdE family protein [Deltaproteobacteria bacterium]
MKNYFEEDLKKAREFHGHICTGIVFGTRIARLGLNYLGIEDPEENRDFMVFVEADRCIADAVAAVTGCSLGRRRLKWLDYGKMAASFVDMNTKQGIRIATVAGDQPGDDIDPVAFWSGIPDGELFRIEPITVDLAPYDLPGRPLRRAVCSRCGEAVMDNRDLQVDGETLCKACAGGAYYHRESGHE